MLRKANTNDFPFLYRLYMHPEANTWLLYEQTDEETFRPVMDELIKRGHLYIYAEQGLPVGMCKLQPMRHRNSHIVYLGGVAVDPDVQGRGHGARMISSAIDLSKEMGFRRIELTVATINDRAIRLYLRFGFVKEGVLQRYSYLQSKDQYLDEYVMGLLL